MYRYLPAHGIEIMLNLEKVNKGLYNVSYGKSNKLGIIYMEVDGYFVFQPEEGSGFWNEYSLTLIVDKLKELNKDWDKHLMDNLL